MPLLVFALALHVPLVYLYESRPAPADFIRSLHEDGWTLGYMHLWFLGHLLLIRACTWRGSTSPTEPSGPQNLVAADNAAIAAGLAMTTWIVRGIWQSSNSCWSR